MNDLPAGVHHGKVVVSGPQNVLFLGFGQLGDAADQKRDLNMN